MAAKKSVSSLFSILFVLFMLVSVSPAYATPALQSGQSFGLDLEDTFVGTRNQDTEESTLAVCPSSMGFGETIQCSILTPGEADTYTFAGIAGDKVLVKMSKSSGSLWPQIRVYNPGGTQICETYSSETAEIASCNLTGTGTYSILAFDHFGTGTGDYYLYLQRLNDPGSPTPIDFGETLFGSVITPAEMDTYTFTGDIGDKVLVRMSKAAGTLWPQIRVYNSAGTQLCETYSTETAEIASCNLTSTGTYTILAYDHFGTDTGDYYIHLQRLNNPGSPVPIDFGETLFGSVITPAEMDAYTFSGDAGDRVLVRMSKAAGTLWPEIRVYNPSGVQLCDIYSTETAEIASCNLTSSGTHTILAYEHFGTSTGDYYLYLQRLNNPGSPTPAAFGETPFASVITPAEMDTYTFDGDAGDKVLVRMSKAAGTLWPEIRVYSPAGVKLCDIYSTETAEIASCNLTSTGTHTILAFDHFGTATGDYYVHLQRLNNPGDPVSIAFGQTLLGSNITPAEMDAHTFTIDLTGKVIVRMTRSAGTLWPHIRVYNPEGTQLCETYSSLTAEIASCNLTSIGTYTILAFDHFGTNTGDYYLYLQWLNTSGNPVSISGNAGTVGVTLSYNDGVAKSVTSDGSGFYSITVPSGWSGKVTPSKPGVDSFTPSFRFYTNLTANQSGQNYTPIKVTSFMSVGAQDGWILESTETSNMGGALNTAATTLRLGDNSAKRQYRSVLTFVTKGLPDNAVITKITLKLRKQGIIGAGNPITMFQGLMVDIKKGTFGTSALQITDFQAAANKTYGPFKPPLVNGWYSINLTNAKAYVNKLASNAGLTQIRLRFKLDDNNNTIANTLSLYSGNSPVASRPTLIIEYHVP